MKTEQEMRIEIEKLTEKILTTRSYDTIVMITKVQALKWALGEGK